MKEIREPILVLCDQEEEYAQLMTEYLRTHKDLPWCVHTYTSAEKMIQEEKDCRIDIMVVAERTYLEQMASLHPMRMIVLTETGLENPPNAVHVNKYQEARNVLQSFLEVYLEIADISYVHMAEVGKTVFLGMYSPVGRCFQTTFALTMSQMLAEKYRTLYLNFEHFSGISEIAAREGARDLADLLYFLMAEKEKFLLRLKTIALHHGNLDYVPPMKSGQNLLAIPAEEWKQLLSKLDEAGTYDYVIMDLSESMQGLFEILRYCTAVFTLTKEDHIARGKLNEYENLLKAYAYEDVLHKTRRCTVPKIKKVPDTLDQYTKSDMADFVRGQIKELERGKR